MATDVAELNMARKYTKFAYHNDGQRWLVFGGDTGGRYLKFGYIGTHQAKANKGLNFNIALMVEKFKETYANLKFKETLL